MDTFALNSHFFVFLKFAKLFICLCIPPHRPFYEARANYNGLLKAQKQKINELESRVTEAKMTYNEALKNLEQISEDIHRQRQEQRDLLNDTLLPQLCAVNNVAPTAQNYQHFSCEELDTAEEYLQLPAKLSTQSSPVHQRRFDEHECPHLLQDFPTLNLREVSAAMHKNTTILIFTNAYHFICTQRRNSPQTAACTSRPAPATASLAIHHCTDRTR